MKLYLLTSVNIRISVPPTWYLDVYMHVHTYTQEETDSIYYCAEVCYSESCTSVTSKLGKVLRQHPIPI